MSGRLWAGMGLVAAALIAACGGMNVSLGPPEPTTVFVIKQPEGRKYHYLVHVSNADRNMDEQRKRHRKVREALTGHCHPDQIVDLYAHPVGVREQTGAPLLSYTVGVVCAEP
ncbi:MAG: hypothetical protein OEY97_03125 [Nitrospirota bacterium]|nr:hypothetical protein [Nitrospirota bacterium]